MAFPSDFFKIIFPKISQLPKNNIHCLLIKIEGEEKEWLTLLYPLTTAKEQRNAEKFLYKKDAVRHLLARALLRKVLDIDLRDFSYTDFGKPYLPDNTFPFTISHSGDIVCIAFLSCPKTEIGMENGVGIDVEEIRPLEDISSLIYQLHSKEKASLEIILEHNANSTILLHAFYRCWTRKEALAKACGLGLHLDFTSFQVSTQIMEQDWIVEYPPQISYNMHNKKNNGIAPPWTSYDININEKYSCSVIALIPKLNKNIITLCK